MTSRRTDLLFHAGGEAVEQYGTIVRKTLRDDDNGYTATRSGTIGPYVDFDGVLRAAAANIPRVDWQDGDAYLLLEAARTNLVTSDDISAWTNNATGMSVNSSISDPAGGTGAYDIVGDGTVTTQGKYTTVSFTGNAVKSALFVVKEDTMPASGVQSLTVYDQSAAQFRLRLDITAWSDGQPTITETTGTHLGSQYIGNGFWAVYGQTTSVTAANTHFVIVYSNRSASAGTITVYRANVFDATVPSYSILDASETRNADSFYADFPYPPQEMTVYAQWHEAGTAFISGSPSIVEVGDFATDGTIQIRRDNSSGDGRYDCALQSLGSHVSLSEPSATVTYGDSVEFVAQVASSGAVTGIMSVNGAAIVTGSAGSTRSLPASFTNNRVKIGDEGVSAIRSVKVARGIKTMAQMRAL
jgi:hypothetical protein